MLWLVCLAGLFSVSASYAVVTDSLTIGNAKALALGNAVTADPPGIDSIHFNVAGLAALDKRQYQFKVVNANFSIKMDIGDYNAERQHTLDMYNNGEFPDGYFYDEAHNSKSKTEGASLLLPYFGLTDLPVVLAPLGGASYSPPGSDMTMATNVYSPMLVGFYRAKDDPGRFMGERMSFVDITYFSPSFAYKVNDEFTFGMALTFNYVGVGLDLPFREANFGLLYLGTLQNGCQNNDPNLVEVIDLVPELCAGRLGLYDQLGYLSFEVENPLTIGFNTGMLWKPTGWLTFGANYIAPFKMDMRGDFVWTNGTTWNNFIKPLLQNPSISQVSSILGLLGYSFPVGEDVVKGKAHLQMDMPEQLMLGTSIQVTPSVKMNVDYKYAGWSSWKGIDVEFSKPIDFLRLAEIIQPTLANRQGLTFPLGLKDTWNWAVGFEYQYSDNLVLRCGVEDRPSSLPKGGLTPLLPVGSGKLYGTGFGLKMQSGATMDLGVGYFHSALNMPGGTSPLGNDTNPFNVIYNPYSGSDIKTDLSFYMLEFSYRQYF